MHKTCVVIPTYKSPKLLTECLQSIDNHEAGAEFDVYVVDNAQEADVVVPIIKSFPKLNIKYFGNEVSGYDTGAYIQVYRESLFKYSHYLFIHDDCEIMEDDWLVRLLELQKQNRGVVCLSTFEDIWGPERGKEYCEKVCGIPILEKGLTCIFGPIFFTERAILNAIEMNGFMEYPPTCKAEQQSYERAWGLICNKLNIPIHSLAGNNQFAMTPHYYKPGHILMHKLTERA